MRGASFSAVSGCLRAGQLLLVWLEPTTTTTSTEGENTSGHKLTVTMVELSALLSFMVTRDSAAGGAVVGVINKYVTPLSLGELSEASHALHHKWSVTVPHALTNMSSILRETAHLHALLLVYVYCIADRVFLMTLDGTVFLLLSNRYVILKSLILLSFF